MIQHQNNNIWIGLRNNLEKKNEAKRTTAKKHTKEWRRPLTVVLLTFVELKETHTKNKTKNTTTTKNINKKKQKQKKQFARLSNRLEISNKVVN